MQHRRINISVAIITGMLICIALPALTRGGDVASTKHNLTSTGPGAVKVGGTGEVCRFCHTPHAARPAAPLWNRRDSGAYYDTYESSTLKAVVGQPTGASRLCLSCHDGTIALAQTYNPLNDGSSTVYISAGNRGYIGTDLTDDHPISFEFTAALSAQKGELRDPSTLPPELPLDHNNQLQCTTCHDAHDNVNGMFLRMSNLESAMCITCHQLTDWATSPHATSTASLSNATRDTWDNLQSAATVRQAACGSCHRPHSGGGKPRLLRREVEEDNCYSCHDGSVAQTDILAVQNKFSRHPVNQTVGVHDPTEAPATMPHHVECADCHDPHRMASTGTANAPYLKPSMRGVSGVNVSGSAVAEATYEYEVCYKCHAGADPAGTPIIDRVVQNANVADEFNVNNASFHPVQTHGRNTNVPSLLQPWTTTSIVYCTDCHGSNAGGSNAKGPHGSDFKPLLTHNYDTVDNAVESPSAYALCYSCHNRDSILGDESFSSHRKHIVDTSTPCSVCHDAHGVSANQSPAGSSTHLINFDRDVVQPAASGDGPTFQDTGVFTGNCTLSCHGEDHQNLSYP